MNIKQFAKKYHGIDLPNHQMKWIKFLEKIKRRGILLAPRGHGKSTIVGLIYLSWLIANDPTLNILIVSHSKEMAEAFSRSVRAVFERDDILEDFGIETTTPWRAGSWTLKGSVANKPTVRTVGVMGKMTGWRGDIVIFDDVLEVTAVSSEAIRIKIKRWINSEVMFALNPGPRQRCIVVGTRKHIDDWYGELLQNPDYEKRVDKALRDNGTVLWPEVYPREELDAIKRERGALYFAQEMQNEPSPPEGLEFKYEWLQFYEHLPTHTGLKYYIGIDPSHGSKSKRATYFSYCVVAHDTFNDKIYVVEMFRDKMSQREQVNKCISVINKYAIDSIYVENVFAYTHVYDALREKYRNVNPIDYIHTKISGTTALNKLERIKNVLAPSIEMGRIIFKEPSLDHFTKTFIQNEYVAYPLGDTDMLDSLTLAVNKLVNVRRIRDAGDIFFFPK